MQQTSHDWNKILWIIFILAFLPLKGFRTVGVVPAWILICAYLVMIGALTGICILNSRKLSPLILLILIMLVIWTGYDIVHYALHPY